MSLPVGITYSIRARFFPCFRTDVQSVPTDLATGYGSALSSSRCWGTDNPRAGCTRFRCSHHQHKPLNNHIPPHLMYEVLRTTSTWKSDLYRYGVHEFGVAPSHQTYNVLFIYC